MSLAVRLYFKAGASYFGCPGDGTLDDIRAHVARTGALPGTWPKGVRELKGVPPKGHHIEVIEPRPVKTFGA